MFVHVKAQICLNGQVFALFFGILFSFLVTQSCLGHWTKVIFLSVIYISFLPPLCFFCSLKELCCALTSRFTPSMFTFGNLFATKAINLNLVSPVDKLKKKM